jgi:hypothetical protein
MVMANSLMVVGLLRENSLKDNLFILATVPLGLREQRDNLPDILLWLKWHSRRDNRKAGLKSSRRTGFKKITQRLTTNGPRATRGLKSGTRRITRNFNNIQTLIPGADLNSALASKKYAKLMSVTCSSSAIPSAVNCLKHFFQPREHTVLEESTTLKNTKIDL